MAKIDILKKEETLWEINVDGAIKTALATGIPNRVFQGTDMSRLRSVPGYVWSREDGIEEWPIEGMAEKDNQIIFWGRKLDLIPVDTSKPFSADEMSGLTELFLLLREKSEAPAFSLDAFFRTNLGGLFCFPLNLMEFIHSRQSKELLMSREIYNHPDHKKEERLSHSLAILAFQGLTGGLPYTKTGGYEWIHEEMRRKKLPSLDAAGEGDGELARAIDGALEGSSFLSLEDWAKIWKRKPELPGSVSEAYRNQMAKYEEGFVKSFNRRKNQIKIIITAVLCAAVLWIGFSLVRSYLAPPFTDGMPPREVVETFFDSINSLDSTAVDGTTEKKAGKEISNQVATMYVMAKNKQAYSQGATLSPVEWAEQGYPALAPGVSVYGVSDLTLTDLGDNRFEASYLVWYPPTSDMDNPEAYVDPHDIYRKKEIITVVRDKRDRSWIIGAIETVSSVSVPSREILPDAE